MEVCLFYLYTNFMTDHNKLVRDRIPEIIVENGAKANTRIIESNDEYIRELSRKLVEEAGEVLETPTIEELADTQEVIDALVVALGHTATELHVVQADKALKRGKFDKRIYLIDTED